MVTYDRVQYNDDDDDGDDDDADKSLHDNAEHI